MKISKVLFQFPLYLIIAIFFQSNLSAQTLGFTVECGDAEIGSVYCAPVKVFGFSEMISIQFSLNWDETVLTYKELQNENLDHLDGAYSSISASELVLSWVDFGYEGISRPDSTVIFDICFDVTGNLGDTTGIVIQAPSNSGVMEISNLNGIIANDDIDFQYNNCPVRIVMSVATQEESLDLFSMFPNPASDQLIFNSDKSFSKIQISDNQGKSVLETDYSEIVDISNLSSGWYMVKLSSKEETAVQKLFVIRD